MRSVEQPMEASRVPGLLVYKRQKKRLEDTVHERTNGVIQAAEEEISSAAEEPDKGDDSGKQTDQRDVQKVDAAGDVVEKTNKEAEKNVNVNQTAEVTGVTETNSERQETVENRAAAKPSKPLLGFQRRPKRQRENEENGAVVSPKKKVMTGKGKQAGSDEDEVEDDLETTRSRRETNDDQEDHLEEDYGDGTEDDAGVTKTKGKKLRKETEKANQRPAKRLKKSGAKSLSKKMVKKLGAVNTSEDLSIHGTVQERAQSTGLSEPVYQWLNELGLLKYAEHFETHEVDDGALPLLTFEDLREMGICAVGTRRKMFTSIQAMGKKMQGD